MAYNSIDFNTCPACKGDPFGTYAADTPFTSDHPCQACQETGERIIDRDVIDEALRSKDWLDERIANVFVDYCQVFKIHKAYGVDEWRIEGNELHIKQDTSCRGCYDYEWRRFPLEYLYLDGDERIAKMQEDYCAQHKTTVALEQEKKRSQILALEKQLETLRKAV